MGIRILVAEEQDAVRSLICRTLESEGYEVTPAATATEALHTFGASPFPLVLVDLETAGVDAAPWMQQLHAVDPEALVVLMGTEPDPAQATAALELGAHEVIARPSNGMRELSAAVRRAARQARLIQDNRELIDQLRHNADRLAQLNRQMRSMEDRDGLTGLHNNQGFLDLLNKELSHAVRRRGSFALVRIGVDHFKHYNDRHGHLAGDELLKVLGELLERHNRATTVVARYGGDEFALLVRDTDLVGGMCCGENVRSAIERHSFEGQREQPHGKVTVSVGVSGFPEHGQDAAELLRSADSALYAAKKRGRNSVCRAPSAD